MFKSTKNYASHSHCAKATFSFFPPFRTNCFLKLKAFLCIIFCFKKLQRNGCIETLQNFTFCIFTTFNFIVYLIHGNKLHRAKIINYKKLLSNCLFVLIAHHLRKLKQENVFYFFFTFKKARALVSDKTMKTYFNVKATYTKN